MASLAFKGWVQVGRVRSLELKLEAPQLEFAGLPPLVGLAKLPFEPEALLLLHLHLRHAGLGSGSGLELGLGSGSGSEGLGLRRFAHLGCDRVRLLQQGHLDSGWAQSQRQSVRVGIRVKVSVPRTSASALATSCCAFGSSVSSCRRCLEASTSGLGSAPA